MKKATIAAAAAVVLAALGLPRVLGGMTESALEQRVAAINAEGVLAVGIDDYQRGWFSSRADLTVRPAPEYVARIDAGPAELPPWFSADSALPVRVTFGHGPVGFTNGPFVGLSSVFAEANTDSAWVARLTETHGMPYLFEFHGRTGFTGRLAFEADVPPVDTTATGGNTRLSGAVAEGTLAGNRLVGELEIEALATGAPGVSMTMTDLSATADTRFLGDNRNTGTAALEIAELGLAIEGETPQSLQMTGARLATDGALEEGAWHTRLDYTADSMTLPNGQEITSAALGVAVADVNAEALAGIQALLDGSAAAGGPNSARPNLLSLLNELLAGMPTLEIAPINFVREGDAFDASVQVEAREDATPLNPGALAGGPAAWARLVDGRVDATVAKPLARQLAVEAARAQTAAQQDTDPSSSAQLAESQASLMLVMLTGQGFIEETEDAYTTQIRLSDGMLTVNGQPLPVLGAP